MDEDLGPFTILIAAMIATQKLYIVSDNEYVVRLNIFHYNLIPVSCEIQ